MERFADQGTYLVVIELGELDTDPAAYTNVGRSEINSGRLLDQSSLHTGSGRQPHGDAAIAVVIIRKHRKYSLRSEKCRLAVRDLFAGAGNRHANTADTGQLLAAIELRRWSSL